MRFGPGPLLLPATPITAPRIGEATVDVDCVSDPVGGASTSLVRPFNLAGVPALTALRLRRSRTPVRNADGHARGR